MAEIKIDLSELVASNNFRKVARLTAKNDSSSPAAGFNVPGQI
jgi:hypothetical protein